MAELATPSAATMATSNATETPSTAPAADKSQKVKPEKPDEETYKTDLTKAEKEHAAVQERLNAIKGKLDLARPPNKDSPVAKRQQELRSQLASIRQQQQTSKSSRGHVQDKIKNLDTQLKSRINEQKTARSRVQYKNVEEVDREIQRLEKQVDAGTMKLVDEKKALADISSLRKQRKGFAGFDEAEKGISDVKAQISELRKSLDDPESKALSEKYSGIAKELDDIKAEQDEAYKNINSLRDERTKIQAEQQEKYTSMRAIKDKYYQAKKAHADYEHEAYRQRKERQKTERETWEKEKRRKVADQKLEEAGAPAYMDEILTSEGLIRYFDPSAAGASSAASAPGSKFAAHAQRTVDDSNIKGTRVMAKKDEGEENYFMGTGGKKGKKGRKGGAAPAAASPAATPTESGKFSLSIGIIEELAKVNVEPPMNQSDVPTVVEKLKEKLDHWKKDQKRKTQENIEKAQKEITRLESDSKDEQPSPFSTTSKDRRSKDTTAKKPVVKNDAVNGTTTSADSELAQANDASADVVNDLEKATIEDHQEEA